MTYVIGAAVMIAAMALLHTGRRVVQRLDATGARTQTLVLDAFALGYTALFAIGLMLMAQHVMEGVTIGRLIAFLAALAAAVAGSKLVAAAFRRAARPVAGPPPLGGAPAA